MPFKPMTFREVVWKNFIFGIQKYIAFFFCSTFTIAIFFIFSNLSFSKEIDNFMKKAGIGADYVFTIMVVILSVFSVGFISYINSSKNKSRSKEFGLYMTMGMSYKDITRLIIMEDSVIAGASIAAGIILGMIFSRLFFLINIRMIEVENAKFVLDYRSFILTVLIFAVVYLVNLLLTIVSRQRMNIRELITADRETEYSAKKHSVPTILGFLMMLAFAAVSIGAALSRDIAMKRIPVIAAILIGMAGMYLVISNITGVFSGAARKNKKFYAKSLLSLSELKYTSGKNTKVLFILSLLSGMILLCSASTFALLSISDKISDSYTKSGITYIEAMGVNNFESGLVEKLVRESGAGLKDYMEYNCTFVTRTDTLQSQQLPICAVRSSTLEKMLGDRVILSENQAEILASDPLLKPEESSLSSIEISNGAVKRKIELKGTIINKSFRTEIVLGNRFILVLGDKLYEELAAGSQFNGIIHDIHVDEWRKTGMVFDRLSELRDNVNPLSQHFTLAGNYPGYILMKRLYSTFVFVTNFISLLFFSASILILLFRQYEGTDKMARKYSQLRKLGMTRGEFRKFVGIQNGFIFIVPLVFGLLMGACLMLIIQSIMGGNDLYGEFWSVSAKVAILYAILQIVFCKVVAEGYFKRIISVARVK